LYTLRSDNCPYRKYPAWHPFERRSIGRTKILKAALIFFSEKTGVQSCTVRDVTNSGAGIIAQNLQIMPLDFALSFDGFGTLRSCRLVWRHDDSLGVFFENYP
jgi:hypothetical protein